jgi:hypothetical protein
MITCPDAGHSSAPLDRTPPLQADLVAIIASSLPHNSAVDDALMACFLSYLHLQGCLGNEHKARARAAVLGALSRGLRVKEESAPPTDRVYLRQEMLADLLMEHCEDSHLVTWALRFVTCACSWNTVCSLVHRQ